MDRARVLVVEDDGEVRDLLAETLTQWGYDVTAAGDGAEALTLLDGRLFDVALLDISLPGKDGLRLLEEIKGRDSAVEVVMMTGNPMVSTSVQTLKAGASDYLIKPLNLEELQPLMSQLIERRFLRQEVGSLRARLGRELAEREIVGTSPQMREVKQTIASVATSDSPVLIEGERDRKSTRLNSSHPQLSRMPSSAGKKKKSTEGVQLVGEYAKHELQLALHDEK